MKNGNEPINAIFDQHGRVHERGDKEGDNEFIGLTKREYFAGLAMQGMLANSINNESGVQPYYMMGYDGVAKNAIAMADELLKQLEEQK